MKNNMYLVTLTNGETQQTYRKYASCEREAMILAQASAILTAHGYELVLVEQVN